MKTFTIQIKNMVCPRCIHVVEQILSSFEVTYIKVELGYAIIESKNSVDLELVNHKLKLLGLGLVEDQDEVLVSKIKRAIHHYLDEMSLMSHKVKLSEYLAQELARNYHQLSKVYSRNTGETIEQYFIKLRTDLVKENIRQGELNLSQIAVNVGFSSIHYLSGQFKKYTGISLSQYKKEWEASLSTTNNSSTASQRPDCGCEKPCNCEGIGTKDKEGDSIYKTFGRRDLSSALPEIPLEKYHNIST